MFLDLRLVMIPLLIGFSKIPCKPPDIHQDLIDLGIREVLNLRFHGIERFCYTGIRIKKQNSDHSLHSLPFAGGKIVRRLKNVEEM